MGWKNIIEDRLDKTGSIAGNEAVLKLYLKERLNEHDAAGIVELKSHDAFRELPVENHYSAILNAAQEVQDGKAEAWDRLTELVNDLPQSTRERLAVQLSESEQLAGNEALIKAYLLEELERREQHPELERDVAYDIAGLMGSPVFQSLPLDNPLAEILAIAGDLELPPDHRDSSSTWERFTELVKSLPYK